MPQQAEMSVFVVVAGAVSNRTHPTARRFMRRPSLPAPTTGNGSNGTPCRRSNESRFSTAEPLAKVVATLISIHERAKHSRFAVLGQGEGSRKRMAVDGGPCPRMDAGVAARLVRHWRVRREELRPLDGTKALPLLTGPADYQQELPAKAKAIVRACRAAALVHEARRDA